VNTARSSRRCSASEAVTRPTSRARARRTPSAGGYGPSPCQFGCPTQLSHSAPPGSPSTVCA
jgi:hypothetical protein